MSAAASLRLVAAEPEGAVRRIHLLMRQRDALRPLFRMAWDNLAARFEADELEGWAVGVLALADVNAGPSCLVAFWEISRNQPTDEGIAPLIVAAHDADEEGDREEDVEAVGRDELHGDRAERAGDAGVHAPRRRR